MPSLVRRNLIALLSVSLIALGAAALAPSSWANGVAPPGCSETFSGGDGTTADPFLISSAADFTALNGDSNCWSGEFLQTANIDMGAVQWNATTGTSATPFSGTYDGSEYTISNLEIYVSGDNAGLFGVVTGTIRNVKFEASLGVVGEDHVGGLVGYLDGGTVSDSSTSANAYGDNYVGGLVGEAVIGSVVQNSYATGSVEGGSNDNYIGGLIGKNYGSVSGSYATGNVLHDDGEAVGGLMGENGGNVANSYATGNVGHATGDDPGADIGGLIGLHEQDAVVSNSFATGNVTGFNDVGGLVGRTKSGSTVSRSYATGAVTREDKTPSSSDKTVGGFVGIHGSGSMISDSYATGNVIGGDAGGFVGENDGSITNSYSTGSVTGDSTAGFALDADTNGTVTSSFWDLQTSGAATSNGGTGLSTEAMKERNTYVGADWSIADGFNAGSTWGICAIANNGYPYLSWTSPTSPCGPALTYEFTFSLPDGQECGPISPMAALAGVWVALPATTADCTVDGATIIGWSVRGMDGYFQPGQQVLAVGAQQFTAVLSHSRVAVTSDANVAADDACMTADGNTELDQRVLIEEPGRDSLGEYRAPLAPTCTPVGVTFAGWDYRSAGVVLAPGDALPAVHSATNTVHLFALWVAAPTSPN